MPAAPSSALASASVAACGRGSEPLAAGLSLRISRRSLAIRAAPASARTARDGSAKTATPAASSRSVTPCSDSITSTSGRSGCAAWISIIRCSVDANRDGDRPTCAR